MTQQPMDLNGDGYAETLAMDTDGDGYAETLAIDNNGDGYAEFIQVDTNHDGYGETGLIDTNGDGYAETLIVDADGDGTTETMVADTDGDGYAETPIGAAGASGYTPTNATDTASGTGSQAPSETMADTLYGLVEGAYARDEKALADFKADYENSGPHDAATENAYYRALMDHEIQNAHTGDVILGLDRDTDHDGTFDGLDPHPYTYD